MQGPSDDSLSACQTFVLRRLNGTSPRSILGLADDVASEVSEAPADPAVAYYELVCVELPQLKAADIVEFDSDDRIVKLTDPEVSPRPFRRSLSANWLAVAGPLAVLVLLGGMIGATLLAGATLLSAVLVTVVTHCLGRGDASGSAPATDVTDTVRTDRHILELLLANDGRMKQQCIVEAVDVSAASVSRHLSELDDQGRIDKVPIGRENVIQLAGLQPLADLDG